MQIAREEFEAKAKEINDSILGEGRRAKPALMKLVKAQVDASAKFALGKALMMNGISEAERQAFIGLLKEQKDAINLLMVDGSQKAKSAEMLSPIFGYKAKDFIGTFQDIFRKLQAEIQLDMRAPPAG